MRLLVATVLAWLISLAGSENARAEIVFAPAFSYRSVKEDTDPEASSELITSVRLGHLFKQGWFAGGHYSRKASGSGDTQIVQSLYGVSGGFVKNGFNIILTYFLAGDYTDKAGDGSIGASGPQIDVGWYGEVGKEIGLGPQLTWNSIGYSKSKIGGVEAESTRKVTEIRPMIALWFLF